jgi:hypothetical protein
MNNVVNHPDMVTRVWVRRISAVKNHYAYAVVNLPASGELEAVDHYEVWAGSGAHYQ